MGNRYSVTVLAPPESEEAIRALNLRNDDGSHPHVHCEGARFHVISYTAKGRACSEPKCVINALREKPVARPTDGEER